jgi:signal transduction histidine kinase
VARLARAQERELRSWLYRAPAPRRGTLRVGLEQVAAEVEDAHGVPVEVVVVGDCPLDEPLSALLQAAREALVNAAKYAPGAPVSLYAEVDSSAVDVYVRDRGPGFEVADIPEDRLGVRQSIIGRMARNGGRATVRPAPGGGTEVALELPRTPAAPDEQTGERP